MDLVDFLLTRGRLDPVHRARVLEIRREGGESESVIITRLGMMGEREMADCLADFLKIPRATAEDYPDTPYLAAALPAEFLVRARAVPLKDTSDGVALAMADPTDAYTIKAVRLAAGRPVMPWAAVPSELAAALARLYGTNDRKPAVETAEPHATAAPEDLKRLADLASEEPVIRYVNWLVSHAAALRASDIHIEADPDR